MTTPTFLDMMVELFGTQPLEADQVDFHDDDGPIEPLIMVARHSDGFHLLYMISTEGLTTHEYALVLCDLIRKGADRYGVDPDVIYNDLVRDYYNPEVQSRYEIDQSGNVTRRVFNPPRIGN
jgi:hypothetical protein